MPRNTLRSVPSQREDYDSAVAEFRQLDEEIEQDRWRQAEIVYELYLTGSTFDAIGQSVGHNRTHIARLHKVWDTYGRGQSAAEMEFASAYRMIETGTDDPDEASEIKNANRASSAIGQLPEDKQREIYEDLRNKFGSEPELENGFDDDEEDEDDYPAPSPRPHPKPTPEPGHKPPAYLVLDAAFCDAITRLDAALKDTDGQPLTDDQKEALAARADQLSERVDRAYERAGRMTTSSNIDAEIIQLFGGTGEVS